jgi:sugar phosphate isomerase/epimerase
MRLNAALVNITMKNPIIMHVNYCEQGQSFDEMCRKAVKWGFDGIEFRRQRYDRNWNVIQEDPEKYLEQVVSAAKKAGLKNILFGGPGVNLMDGDKAKQEKELENAVNFYRLAAKRVQLTVCNTMTGSLVNPDKNVPHDHYDKHGSAIATPAQWQAAVDGFKKLGKLAEELGFKFAFETHPHYLHDYPLVTKELVDRINSPAVGVNLDYGNAFEMPNNPALADTIRQISGKIYYVHLKNAVALPGGGFLPTSLADGAINHREYLKLLREVRFSGPICIEAPRGGDREWFARHDIAYLKRLMKEIE